MAGGRFAGQCCPRHGELPGSQARAAALQGLGWESIMTVIAGRRVRVQNPGRSPSWTLFAVFRENQESLHFCFVVFKTQDDRNLGVNFALTLVGAAAKGEGRGQGGKEALACFGDSVAV